MLIGMSGALFALTLIPSRIRLETMLALMVVWLGVGQLPDLGPIALAAKMTVPGAFFLLFMATWLEPGPRRPLHPACWLYLIMALIAPIFVISTIDAAEAVFLRCGWIFLVISAL